MSVKQPTLEHSHDETLQGCRTATALSGRVFRPTLHSEIYSFEDLPRAIHAMGANRQMGIPIVHVAKTMPDWVRQLVP